MAGLKKAKTDVLQHQVQQERKINYKPDGDNICATFEDFIDPMKSPCGYWKTEDEARMDLFAQEKALHDNKKPYWCKIMICVMQDDMPHEIATATLRAKVPFTKQWIEKFIEDDANTKKIKQSLMDDDKSREIKIIYVICNDQ